jgi:L-threonylcarbamoyladenylate synthase
MAKIYKDYNEEVLSLLKGGGVGILLTDTLYGIVGRADMQKTVERIYEIKNRPYEKRMLILAANLNQIENLGLVIPQKFRDTLQQAWPERVSVELPISERIPPHLHRGHKIMSARIPPKANLLKLLEQTGPLVAPSANPSGSAPAKNKEEALQYFENLVDFYVDEGEADGAPSTMIGFDDKGEVVVFRKGAFDPRRLLEASQENF